MKRKSFSSMLSFLSLRKAISVAVNDVVAGCAVAELEDLDVEAFAVAEVVFVEVAGFDVVEVVALLAAVGELAFTA
jgi:hypothetical protein